MERINDGLGIIRMKKKEIEVEPLGETLTLDAEAIELIQEAERTPKDLAVQYDLTQKIVSLWQEKSS